LTASGIPTHAPARSATGSTRFVTIPIQDCRPQLDWVKANRDAIWARAVEEVLSGVDWDRCDEAERQLIAERNENFTQIDPWAEDVAEQLARRDKQGQVPVQIPDLLKALEVPKERWSPQASCRVRQIAESRGWYVARKQVGGVRVKGLCTPVPPAGAPRAGSGGVGHPPEPAPVIEGAPDPNPSATMVSPAEPQYSWEPFKKTYEKARNTKYWENCIFMLPCSHDA